MQWLNEPSNWNDSDRTVSAKSDARTDFWRKTHDGDVRHNGHFYFERITGDFSARVKIIGNYEALYDQAGLMVQLDSETWLKCGIEFVHGRQYASAVVTRDYSDWSVVPLENPPAVWLQCDRADSTYTISYSLDGVEFIMMRQAYLTSAPDLQLGMMLASPKGDGFSVRFDDYTVTAQADHS